MSTKTNKTAMSEDIAIQEFHSFLSKWIKRPPEMDAIKELYPESIDALQSGNLIINENGVPVYKLIHPIQGENGLSEITFQTRLKVMTKANLLKNVNVEKDLQRASAILQAHMLGLPTMADLDLLHQWDYNACVEIASVFMKGG